MDRERLSPETLSEFMHYLAEVSKTDLDRLPSLADLSQRLGISIASLREQLEVARALGLVEVRPRTGMRPLPYTFLPAVRQSLAFAIKVDPDCFQHYSDFRNHLELAYWHQAVSLLTHEDHDHLWLLVQQAWQKLRGNPIQIPHNEHRKLHLLIYQRLNNPFVSGAMEAYWEMYEATGMNVYADYQYLEQVWEYHQAMVQAISNGDPKAGYQALLEHMDLLSRRPALSTDQKIE
jgi:DNA-binding FadR family transcriptional regulator